MPQLDSDTICAIATPPGRSGVGILRISGPKVQAIATAILGFSPTDRHAHYGSFLNSEKAVIDQGIALYFRQPNSFTGEDILELQGHGGSIVLNTLRDRAQQLGARLARPGEFSERAFLNNKIDLLQAEAIADLIDASSAQAARSAMRTLQGEFSVQIRKLVQRLTTIRTNVEAAIDFSDEDIDVLADARVEQSLQIILQELAQTFRHAQQGALLKEGINIVIAGKPNAGKSSLLNALSGLDSAIVTDIPGTTRDLLSEEIIIDGMPVHVYDTAGLRSSDDIVEQEGVRRAQAAIEKADLILLVVDRAESEQAVEKLFEPLALKNGGALQDLSVLQHTIVVYNKIDLLRDIEPGIEAIEVAGTKVTLSRISAKQKQGIEILKSLLLSRVGYSATEEGAFVARERHLNALRGARELIGSALKAVGEHSLPELAAEDLRLAQKELGSITGEFTSDDLLGEIFSNFCVGK